MRDGPLEGESENDNPSVGTNLMNKSTVAPRATYSLLCGTFMTLSQVITVRKEPLKKWE